MHCTYTIKLSAREMLWKHCIFKGQTYPKIWKYGVGYVKGSDRTTHIARPASARCTCKSKFYAFYLCVYIIIYTYVCVCYYLRLLFSHKQKTILKLKHRNHIKYKINSFNCKTPRCISSIAVYELTEHYRRARSASPCLGCIICLNVSECTGRVRVGICMCMWFCASKCVCVYLL